METARKVVKKLHYCKNGVSASSFIVV